MLEPFKVSTAWSSVVELWQCGAVPPAPGPCPVLLLPPRAVQSLALAPGTSLWSECTLGRWDFPGIRGEEAALSGWGCDSSRAEVLQIPFLVVEVCYLPRIWCDHVRNISPCGISPSPGVFLTPLSFLLGTCAWWCVGYRKWTVKL